MKEYKNIPIFQYGMNPNNIFISKEVVEKALDSFIDKPILKYDDSADPNNLPTEVIGTVKKVTRLDDQYVYGDVVIFNDEPINKWSNYEIEVEENHDENKTCVIDSFRLGSTSFSFKTNRT